jgi:predicted nucleotidyltransferase component of viral defense system
MNDFIFQLQQMVGECQTRGLSEDYIRLLVKEKLQTQILNYIYSNPKYLNLIFIGGSALRFCYELPRLSEDLDFDTPLKIDKKQLADGIILYFKRNFLYEKAEYLLSGQFGRLTFKFPLVSEIGITKQEGERLFIKLEISEKENLKKYSSVVKSLYKNNFSFSARTYDLSILMAGKINAVLTRRYRKGKKNEINIKGRDYYDLWWYLTKKIVPNWDFIKDEIGLTDKRGIILEIDKKVKEANPDFIRDDLFPLFQEEQFVRDFAKNYRDFYFRESEYLRKV